MREPIGCYPKQDRDLIALADLIGTAIVRLELMASKPEDNEMLIAYFDRYFSSFDECEPWREPLLALIKSVRE
jgi:hypothetical protein